MLREADGRAAARGSITEVFGDKVRGLPTRRIRLWLCCEYTVVISLIALQTGRVDFFFFFLLVDSSSVTYDNSKAIVLLPIRLKNLAFSIWFLQHRASCFAMKNFSFPRQLYICRACDEKKIVSG